MIFRKNVLLIVLFINECVIRDKRPQWIKFPEIFQKLFVNSESDFFFLYNSNALVIFANGGYGQWCHQGQHTVSMVTGFYVLVPELCHFHGLCPQSMN